MGRQASLPPEPLDIPEALGGAPSVRPVLKRKVTCVGGLLQRVEQAGKVKGTGRRYLAVGAGQVQLQAQPGGMETFSLLLSFIIFQIL